MLLIHRNDKEADEHAKSLRVERREVETKDGARAAKRLFAGPPAAVVIDLTCLMSHGRESVRALPSYKDRKTLLVVSVGGKDDALAKTGIVRGC